MNPSYRLTLKMTNTDIRPLKFMQQRLGGSVYEYQDKRGKTGKKQFTWCIYSDAAMKLLEKMLPFLLIKEEQARHCIKFQLALSKRRQTGKLSNKELEEREQMMLDLQRMNKRYDLWAAAETERENPNTGEATVQAS